MGVAARVEEFPNGHYFKMEKGGKGKGELVRYYKRDWCVDRSTVPDASGPTGSGSRPTGNPPEEEKVEFFFFLLLFSFYFFPFLPINL